MKRKTILFILFIALSWQFINAQQVITGTVTFADDGNPLPGVNVVIKGTTTGVITDLNGTYSIEVPEGSAVLSFSFVGMKTIEEQIGGRTTIDVLLESDALNLDEIVVTALGVERSKKSFGYAISEIESEETLQKGEPDMLRSLQGKVAGVDIRAANSTPGSSTRITIRGNSSFKRENQPLIVVDGIPYSNEEFSTSNSLTTGSAYGSGLNTLEPKQY